MAGQPPWLASKGASTTSTAATAKSIPAKGGKSSGKGDALMQWLATHKKKSTKGK